MQLAPNTPEFMQLFQGREAKKIADGFIWTEGPCWIPSREVVVFSDVRSNKTWRYGKHGLELETSPSDHQNGHCLDSDGRLIACSHGLRALLRQEPDGSWTTLVDSFEGKRLNSPNDVTLHRDGSLWFTDPTYGIDKPEEGYGGTMELEGRWVFRLGVNNELSAPIRDRLKPNGLAFGLAGELLLADTGDGQVYRYAVNNDKAVFEGKHFSVASGKTDGLCIDESGRIWSSAADGVHVWSSDGKTELGRILLGEVCSNVCFGGTGNNILYMTASTSFWYISTNTSGL